MGPIIQIQWTINKEDVWVDGYIKADTDGEICWYPTDEETKKHGNNIWICVWINCDNSKLRFKRNIDMSLVFERPELKSVEFPLDFFRS